MTKRKSKSKLHIKTPISPFLIIGLVTLVVIVWYSWPRPTAIGINQVISESGTVELSLNPAARTIEPNTELTISLLATTPNKLTAVQFELTYDAACGTIVATPGTTLPISLVDAKVENGVISGTYGVIHSSGGISGSDLSVLTLKLKPEADGVCHLKFGSQNIATVTTSQTNAIHATSDSVITIAQTVVSPSPSPSLSPSPSPSPSPSADQGNTQKPNKPTGLRSNCFDGGNKITLRWDAVSGADSYKLRLDQKDGTGDKSIDGIKVTEGETTIIPDQKYAWWVHASKGGVDSAEARIDEVICAKTVSTPTPTPTTTPTVKPSVKPTVKPTTSPTVKPTSSISPKASSSSVTSIIPIDQKETGSLNDIFSDTEAVGGTDSSSDKPGFFKMLSLGWQAIFSKLAQIFN